MALTFGVVALARPTFDVAFAESTKDRAFASLERAGINVVGTRDLLFDAAATEQAIADVRQADHIDLMLILQVTFTDATMTVKLAHDVDAALAIWAMPEPRLGGRLRLNALCGLNLAVHALQKSSFATGWLYADPDTPGIEGQLLALAQPATLKTSRAMPPRPPDDRSGAEADRMLSALRETRIGLLGTHPEGFDTCSYDEALLGRMGGTRIDPMTLDDLFEQARAIPVERVAGHHEQVSAVLDELDQVDSDQLDRSLRVYCALQDVAAGRNARALAVRCWPEMFTDYGCASCGPMAMMNEGGVPSACEADVHGAYTQLLLQEAAGSPPWMSDLVDIDFEDDTAVLWHCGSAPLSMRAADSRARATVHTNRKMPLLQEFLLKPGRITLARISQARGEPKMMLAGAHVLQAPMAFTGTSGTVRFEAPAREVLRTIMDEGLEHHYALAYGDHRETLRAVAHRLGLPVLELT